MIITGEKIKLRSLRGSDWESIFKYANDHKVSKYTDIPHPFIASDIKKYIKKSIRGFTTKKSFHFGVETKGEKGIIGIFSLENISYQNKNAELEFWLSQKYWHQGIASDAIKTILRFAFKKLKLNRIYVKVLLKNTASIKFLKKNKFVHEGTLRKMLFEKGKFKDIMVFSILRNEFMNEVLQK